MILAKAPLRVSFLGGGSDIADHYLKHGGATISTAINLHVYVSVMYTPRKHIKAVYSETEIVTNVDDLKNPIIKNCLKHFRITSNIEINTFADIPTVGTGLGGSSAFTCALLTALAEYSGDNPLNIDPRDVAVVASYIEQQLCGWKIGDQDQYASAFGGSNYINYRFNVANGIPPHIVTPINLNFLNGHMVLVPTNIIRNSNAAEVLNTIDIANKTNLLTSLASLAVEYNNKISSTNFISVLSVPSIREKFKELTEKLDEAWAIKKRLSDKISTPEIDALYEKHKNLGALGGKLCGAGGGGYLLLLVDDVWKNNMEEHHKDEQYIEIYIEPDGARVVYNDERRNKRRSDRAVNA